MLSFHPRKRIGLWPWTWLINWDDPNHLHPLRWSKYWRVVVVNLLHKLGFALERIKNHLKLIQDVTLEIHTYWVPPKASAGCTLTQPQMTRRDRKEKTAQDRKSLKILQDWNQIGSSGHLFFLSTGPIEGPSSMNHIFSCLRRTKILMALPLFTHKKLCLNIPGHLSEVQFHLMASQPPSPLTSLPPGPKALSKLINPWCPLTRPSQGLISEGKRCVRGGW